uniref:CSON001965 protein n=1 Tax=Culicoides sonorensis TaxID=179676 RepID=A0A336L038_CULSO
MARDSFSVVLLQMFNNQEKCDVKFICKDKNDSSGKSAIGAHKLILSIASDVFDAMFFGIMVQESDNPSVNEIKIEDIDITIFKLLLSIIYGKDIEFENDEVTCKFYYAANKYNCKDALKFTTNHILKELKPENSLFIYDSLNNFDNEVLNKACLKIFDDETLKVISCDQFLEAYPVTIETIYKSDSLTINSELDLIKALERYIDHNKDFDNEIQTKLRPAINQIRFLTLSSKEIAETSLLRPEEIISVIASLPPNQDFKKMPQSLSLLVNKRISKSDGLKMIRVLNPVFSKQICNSCRTCMNHSLWSCSKALDQTRRSTLQQIFEKYNHTLLSDYSRTDLETVYEIYRSAGYVTNIHTVIQ